MLPDGTYDAFVVDADADADGVRLELTVVAGAHKGDVVAVRTDALTGADPVALLGLPATLTVEGGVPAVTVEP